MIESALPPAIQPLLDAYLHGLEPFQSHFFGIYITDSIALGAFEEPIDPYPVVHDGVFSAASSGGLNAVTWWIIKHHGLCLLGPQRSELPLDVTWKDVLSTMRFNLDIYFARQAKRPYIYWSDVAVEFGVTNLCRIFTTIEEGEIISKSESLKRWRDRLPERWRPLLDEAWRLRHHLRQPSVYPHRLQRMHEALAFIQYGRERGQDALERFSYVK